MSSGVGFSSRTAVTVNSSGSSTCRTRTTRGSWTSCGGIVAISTIGNTGRSRSKRKANSPPMNNEHCSLGAIGDLTLPLLKDLHDKISGKQMLGLRDELAIRPARVIAQAVLTRFPNRQRYRHAPAFLHHQAGGFEAGFTREARQHIRVVDSRKLSDLFLTERFADDHTRVHTDYFPAGLLGISFIV